MKSMSILRHIFLALFFVIMLSVRQSAHGAIVTYTLEVDPVPGTWQLFAEASLGDNQGLALVSVDLVNVLFPVDLRLPQSRFQVGATDVGIEGLFDFRVDSASPIGASQDIFAGSGIVFGLGQTAGSLSSVSGANFFVQQNYDAKLLVAQGTFDNGTGEPLPAFGPGGSATVIDNADDATGPVELVVAARQQIVVNLSVPEPSSLVLLCLGVLACAGMTRRR
ncbi:MAG: PEP-CTERM sorting domain-containing protein [Planctomycetes bacterium]|nr:PEP-CTERM sorting domain-containing protein [Planctomycetota bacterium]